MLSPRCLTRRAALRLATASAALTVAGCGGHQPTGPVGAATAPALRTPIARWPARGSWIGQRALLDHATEIWRTHPHPHHRPTTGAAIRPIYAALSAPGVLRYLAVVLTATHPDGAADGVEVAIVTTTAVPHDEQPDPRTLLLRAHGRVPAAAPALGVISRLDAARDAAAPSPVALAFAIAAPDTTAPGLRTARAAALRAPDTGGEALWAWPPPDWTAANTAIATSPTGTAALLAGIGDPQPRPLGPVEHQRDGSIVVAGGRQGDVVTIPAGGVVGTVDAHGRLDTDLARLPRDMRATAITGAMLTLTTDPDGVLRARPATPGAPLGAGQLVELTAAGRPRLAIGHLAHHHGGWRVDRVSPAAAATDPAAVLIGIAS